MSESNRPSAPSVPAEQSEPETGIAAPGPPSEPSAPVRSSLRLRASIDGAEDAWPEYAKVPTAAARALVGQVIDGRYRVEALLGIGAMGVVYRCRHEQIDRLVAIKVIREDLAGDAEATDRFLREAKAATAVGSPHIVETLDFGRLPEGATYYVMEYLDGRSLADLLAEQALEIERTLRIAHQVAEALGEAHNAGIVHRDLKPDNVFVLDRKGEDFVKILDFGIAKVATAENKLTRAGAVFGTPHYMSPEQACGMSVDHRADIYALGVILYEMLAGRVPFDGDGPMAIMSQHVHTEPTPPSVVAPTRKIPPGIESIALKCLQKLPSMRYESMRDVMAELDAVQAGAAPRSLQEPVREPVASPVGPRGPEARRRLIATLVTGAAAAATGVIAVVAIAAISGSERLPRHLFATPAGIDSALRQASELAEPADQPAPLHDGRRQVAVVVSPIDAEVWQDGRNLGVMPVTVEVREAERVTIEVRRRGFRTERVGIDGSRARIVVRLIHLGDAVPGALPAASAVPGAIPPANASASPPAQPTPVPASAASAEPPAPAPTAASPPAPAPPASVEPPASAAGPEPRLPAELHPAPVPAQ